MDERGSARSSANGASEQDPGAAGKPGTPGAGRPRPSRAGAGAGSRKAAKAASPASSADQGQGQSQETQQQVQEVTEHRPELPAELVGFVKKQLDVILEQIPAGEPREQFKAAMAIAAGGKPEEAKPEAKPEAKQAHPETKPTKPEAKPEASPKWDLKKLGIKKKFAGKLPDGYQREAPGLLYVPTANVDLKTGEPRVLEGLAVDVTQWGGHAALVVIPDSDVRVIMPDGTPFDNVATESTSRDPIVIPVDGDTTNIARDLMEDQDFGIVICMVPSFEQLLADGTPMTRHLVGRGEKVPKKGIWPPE